MGQKERADFVARSLGAHEAGNSAEDNLGIQRQFAKKT